MARAAMSPTNNEQLELADVQTWINNTKFTGLYNDSDPLSGQHLADGAFTLQGEPARQRMSGMKRVVHTRGGGYIFMPGIAALERLVTW